MTKQFQTYDAYAEINDAKVAVKAAMQKYSRGGSPDAVNEATRRLADAHQAAWRTAAGLVSDDR